MNRLAPHSVLMALLLGACGGNDTIFTGLSGVIIAIVVIWLIVRAVGRRGD